MGGAITNVVDSALNAVSFGSWDKATNGGVSGYLEKDKNKTLAPVSAAKAVAGDPNSAAEVDKRDEEARKKLLEQGQGIYSTLGGGMTGDTSSAGGAARALGAG